MYYHMIENVLPHLPKKKVLSYEIIHMKSRNFIQKCIITYILAQPFCSPSQDRVKQRSRAIYAFSVCSLNRTNRAKCVKKSCHRMIDGLMLGLERRRSGGNSRATATASSLVRMIQKNHGHGNLAGSEQCEISSERRRVAGG